MEGKESTETMNPLQSHTAPVTTLGTRSRSGTKDELRILGDLWNPDGVPPPARRISVARGLTSLTVLQVLGEQGTCLVSVALGMALEKARFSNCEKRLRKNK